MMVMNLISEFSAGRNKHEAHYLMMKMLAGLTVNTENCLVIVL